MTSSINTVLILTPDKLEYVHIHCSDKEPSYVKAMGFPIYSTDLVLGVDRYPEYELIKHLPNKDIINYFLKEDSLNDT